MGNTIAGLINVAKVDLLLAGGVQNWDWYAESIRAGYVESEDRFKDAESFVSALEAGGVDNWEWYGDSLTGLSEYSDYLESLDNINTAPSFQLWSLLFPNTDKEEDAIQKTDSDIPASEEKLKKSLILLGFSNIALHEYIADKFGDDRADEVYVLAKERGVWKQTTFPKEFKDALKVIQKGVENPLEEARKALLAKVIKNGKLDVFLDSLV